MTTAPLTAEAVAIREAIEFAPSIGVPTAPGLLGNWTPGGWYVCAPCIGRLLARGCGYVLKGATPVWMDAPTTGVCLCCATEEAKGPEFVCMDCETPMADEALSDDGYCESCQLDRDIQRAEYARDMAGDR